MTIIWREVGEHLKAFAVDPDTGRETEALWAPQAGSQEAFLECPLFEVLYTGTRGPGKTDALLMDFGQDVGKGWGIEWRGILFRRSYPELADVIQKTKKWFPRIWPQAKFNEQKSTWTWPDGESLRFSFMMRADDYWQYHGHAYPWIAFEELTTWADDKCYKVMMSCSRSTMPNMPRKYRATTNPYGVGHNWVKARFRLPVPEGQVIGRVIEDSLDQAGETEPPRVAIHGQLTENKILLHADPNYIGKIRAAARNPSELAAWLYGSWDIIAGGMFDDLWNPAIHVVPNIPLDHIPRGWRVDRGYDHGQSKPFSVGWWAESNGEVIEIGGRRLGGVPGDLFRVAEWYGWNGTPNEGLRMSSVDIARQIVQRELKWGIRARTRRGPADSSIFDRYEGEKSVAGDMRSNGVQWDPADKGPGSRVQGWQQFRRRLQNSLPHPETHIREEKGLFICERCDQFLRTVPVLPRSQKDLDDADTDAEDHIADEARYRIRHKRLEASSRKW